MSEVATTEITDMTAAQLGMLYKKKQLSPVEAAESFLAKIESHNPIVNAYSHIATELALESAKGSEQRWFKGTPLSPIDGVPCSIKDLTMVEGLPNRSGSLTTSDRRMDVDAPFPASMKQAGAVIMGKTTTPEFGWKGVTDSRLTGITRNPWNTALTAGGSSGGAAVAAALNLGVLHQASDAGGSIRIPASFCGVFGFKPTFGYIPQWPASAMTTLSHLGPITRTVEDSVLMLDVVAKPDIRDWYSTRVCNSSWRTRELLPLKGCRIAYSPTLGYVNVGQEVKAVTDNVVEKLRDLGADVDTIDPGFSDPIETFSTLWFAGAAKILASLNMQQRELLDPGFLKIAKLGTEIEIVDYMVAVDRRAELGVAMQKFHTRYDILITPTLPNTAFKAGQDTESQAQRDWMEWTPFTYPFNLTQQPAATVPCGLANGLPVGLQIVADRGKDWLTLAVAKHIERESRFKFLNEPIRINFGSI